MNDVVDDDDGDDHSRQTKRENDNPWQKDYAKMMIVEKKKEEKENLQPSASMDDIKNKHTLCDLVDWQRCITNIKTYVIYS